MIEDKLEDLIYHQIGKYGQDIKAWSIFFSLEPALVSSIILVERQQYNLPQALRVLRRWNCRFLDILDLIGPVAAIGEKWTGLKDWVNNSRGFSRIKPETANRAYILQQDINKIFTFEELHSYKYKPEIAIKLTCLILALHKKQWWAMAGELAPDILATLYNISDFINKPAHPNPRPGGSVLPALIDGEYLTGLHFGERVLRVYKSTKMRAFIRNLELD